MLKETLILSGPDIEKLITMSSALRIAERAFSAYSQGKIQMPAKIYLHLDKYRGDFRAMPAYIEGLEACGIKWVNVHPENKKYGLPSVMALIIINDPKTGLPLAVIETVFLYDCLKSQPEIFLKKMRYLDLKMSAAKNIPDCLKNSDIVVTTTPSRRPIVKPEWIKNGTHINAIGADAPGKEELETGILKKAKVVVDDITQAIHSGEINVPMTRKTITRKNIHADLVDIITGKKQGRKSREEITVFDSTGLAILDVAMAHYVYQQARKNKAGKTVKFY